MNHMGNMALAKKMILSAKKNGADIAKFQYWDPKNLKVHGILMEEGKYIIKLF